MDADQIPDFELHNMTAWLVMIYEKILEYSKCQLSAKCDRLRTIN